MATATKTMAATNGSRDHNLRKMLEDRRGVLLREVQGSIRDARTDSTKERQVLDQGESSEVDIQEEIERERIIARRGSSSLVVEMFS